MSDDSPLEAQITELEIKISYAEDMLDALNRTAFSQQQQIDQLIAQVRTLRDQVQASAPAEPRSLREELPPHY